MTCGYSKLASAKLARGMVTRPASPPTRRHLAASEAAAGTTLLAAEVPTTTEAATTACQLRPTPPPRPIGCRSMPPPETCSPAKGTEPAAAEPAPTAAVPATSWPRRTEFAVPRTLLSSALEDSDKTSQRGGEPAGPPRPAGRARWALVRVKVPVQREVEKEIEREVAEAFEAEEAESPESMLADWVEENGLARGPWAAAIDAAAAGWRDGLTWASPSHGPPAAKLR